MKFQNHMEHEGSAQKHEDFACFIQQQKPYSPGRDPQRGTGLLPLVPPCSLGSCSQRSAQARVVAALTTQQARGSTLCTFTPSQSFDMAGASRRRLRVFIVASKFALALYPSAKALLAKKSLARQEAPCVPFFLVMCKV